MKTQPFEKSREGGRKILQLRVTRSVEILQHISGNVAASGVVCWTVDNYINFIRQVDHFQWSYKLLRLNNVWNQYFLTMLNFSNYSLLILKFKYGNHNIISDHNKQFASYSNFSRIITFSSISGYVRLRLLVLIPCHAIRTVITDNQFIDSTSTDLPRFKAEHSLKFS